MTLLYATSSDLQNWIGPTKALPANADALMRTASLAVAEATLTVFYATDVNGMPTAEKVINAFRDATCAQAAALSTANIDPLGGSAVTPGVATRKSVGAATIEYAGAALTAQARAALASGHLCSDAHRILQQAGLVGMNAVWVAG